MTKHIFHNLHNMFGIVHSRYLIIFSLLWMLGACSSMCQIEHVAGKNYPASTKVALLEKEPTRDYVVIARFSGNEHCNCLHDIDTCGIIKQARARGADAVWIQSRQVFTRQGEWVMVEGRLTHIYGSKKVIVKGVFLRYRGH